MGWLILWFACVITFAFFLTVNIVKGYEAVDSNVIPDLDSISFEVISNKEDYFYERVASFLCISIILSTVTLSVVFYALVDKLMHELVP